MSTPLSRPGESSEVDVVCCDWNCPRSLLNSSIIVFLPFWTTCILPHRAFSGARNAAEKAEQTLDYFGKLARRGNAYRRVKPNLNSYNIVINAYAKSRQVDAARKAEAILYRLINQKDKRMRPNSRSFGVVISIWARSKERGAADRAEQLLHQMEKLYVEGNRDAEPNVIVYSTVVSFRVDYCLCV